MVSIHAANNAANNAVTSKRKRENILAASNSLPFMSPLKQNTDEYLYEYASMNDGME
jgi:hypothetical protein